MVAAATTHLPRLKLRPRKKRVDAESILEAEFEREALSTERLRLLVLTAVSMSGLCLSLIPSAFFSEGVERAFHGHVWSFVYWRVAILLLLALYLTAEWVRLGQRIKTGGRVNGIYHYVTAFVETSCPTAEIIALAAYHGQSGRRALDPGLRLSAVHRALGAAPELQLCDLR